MMNKTIIGFVMITLLILAGCGPQIEVDDFETCIEAGNPAMESYPRQCRHGDRTYTEVIDEPIAPEFKKPEKPIGGERDEHDCLPSAGYQWCETTQQCQRYWEQDCPTEDS